MMIEEPLTPRGCVEDYLAKRLPDLLDAIRLSVLNGDKDMALAGLELIARGSQASRAFLRFWKEG